jgi:hypothetical protein
MAVTPIPASAEEAMMKTRRVRPIRTGLETPWVGFGRAGGSRAAGEGALMWVKWVPFGFSVFAFIPPN